MAQDEDQWVLTLDELEFVESAKTLFDSSDPRSGRFRFQFAVGTFVFVGSSLLFVFSWRWWIGEVGYLYSVVVWVLAPFFLFDFTTVVSKEQEDA